MIERVERTPEQVEADLEDIRPQIEAVTRRRVGNQPIFEDAHQEATIAAWTRLTEGYPKEIAIFKAAQRVIDIARGSRPLGSVPAARGLADLHRRSVPLTVTTGAGDEFLIEPAVEEPGYDRLAEEEAALDLVRDMAPVDAKLFWLTAVERFSVKEAAAMVGLQWQSAASRMARARRSIRAVA